MGQARKNKQKASESLEFYDLIIQEAVKIGEQQPDSLFDRADILTRYLSKDYLPNSEMIKGLRLLYGSEIRELKRIKLEEYIQKYSQIDELPPSEQRKFVLKEFLSLLKSDELNLARSNKINELFDAAYANPLPEVRIKVENGEEIGNSGDFQGYDILRETDDKLTYEFKYSNYSSEELELVRQFSTIFSLLEFSPNTYYDDLECLDSFVSIFFEVFASEFGEIQYFTFEKNIYPIFLLMLTINPDAISQRRLLIAKASYDYVLNEDESYLKKTFAKMARMPFLFDQNHNHSSKILTSKGLAQFITLINNFIAENGGYIKPKNSTDEKKLSLQLKIHDFQVCSLSELIKARRHMSSKNNNTDGINLYDPELAQQIDELIRSRYYQMAERFGILQKQTPKDSPITILEKVGNIYDVELINSIGEPNIFGQGVLARIPTETKEITFFEKFTGITFSKQAKQAIDELNQNGMQGIARKIEEVLETIQDYGNVGVFLEKCASNETLTYGVHYGKKEFDNCLLFDVGSKLRLVINMAGDVLYIGDYH